ncbi:MAG: single-stranded DNA-binding protein [Bacilli bacterium]|nr:single-stranded DNA-binding protein [Bacilli bacterium]
MNSMNEFNVVGRLVRDPEIKELENGNKVCNITLAVDREYRDKEDNKITDYLDFALWNKDAERIMKLSKQGALIHLEGAMQPKDIEVAEQKIRTINLKVNKYKHLANKKDLSTEPIEETKTEEMVK